MDFELVLRRPIETARLTGQVKPYVKGRLGDLIGS